MTDSPPYTDQLQRAKQWYQDRNWEMFPFQEEVFQHYLSGKSGLLNAPTGSGKTLAMWLPIILDWRHRHPKQSRSKGLKAIWITPLRALSKDIVKACSQATESLNIPWRVEARTGDTSSSRKAKQKKSMPQGLVTTPESMHVLFAGKEHHKLFEGVEVIVIDEWHELLGTKRGTQTELVIAHLRSINPQLKVWGISATIGNLSQAVEVLLGRSAQLRQHTLVRSALSKQIQLIPVLPSSIDSLPWSGHLGINMVDQVLPIIDAAKTSLLFTNTRAQAELWYQTLLHANPDLAGVMALHHGSIDSKTRSWVEEALHQGQLKVVVCTSSLDLGVDFRPVETVIQIGGPKGVARFIQRAGRSGHHPGALSRIYFVPTHSLELVESAALRDAMQGKQLEDRLPIVLAHDVLIQYLLTLAVSGGFIPEEVFAEVRQTYCYADLSWEEFSWSLDFLTTGGASLYAYDEYQKVEITEEGVYALTDKRMARQHLLSIGTIVSDSHLIVKYVAGKRIGTVEESFVSQLKPGDIFWFSGRSLELVRIRNMEVQVKRSKEKKGKVPRWMGARMILSSQMGESLRQQLNDFQIGIYDSEEMNCLRPLLELQQNWSAVPCSHECLIESIKSREGFHVFIYPFEGRVIHEIMGTLLAWRISQMLPISFSIAMNDYGFELLSDQEIPLAEALEKEIFSAKKLESDLAHAINETEMAQRRFREIARVSGLIFQGFPGKYVPGKHLQANSSLLFRVFQEHEPDNLLLQQAYSEVLVYQIDSQRLRTALDRLSNKSILLTTPRRFTPFSFPIMVDRLRERLSSEKLADRVARMQVEL